MEVISSIYNSGYNIKKFYLGSRELNLAYLGNQVIYDEVIGDNDLNYILYEFYGSDTLPNTVEAPVKSATLKGSTKYRDIDTGDILDTFDETKNLELVSVKLPVLTTTGKNLFSLQEDELVGYQYDTTTNSFTSFPDGRKWSDVPYVKLTGNQNYIISYDVIKASSNSRIEFNITNGSIPMKSLTNIGVQSTTFNIGQDVELRMKFLDGDAVVRNIQVEVGSTATSYEPYKSNILTVNEEVTLRSNGDVYDELNLLTGRLTQRIDENNEVLTQAVVKTVDLTIVDQDGKTINKLNSFNGATHVSTEVAENSAYPMVSLEVASELQAAMSKVTEDIELIKPVQNGIETTIDTQSNDIDSLLLSTTELFEMFL